MAKNQRKVGGAKTELEVRLPLACADEAAAIAFMEEQRGWKQDSDAACPKCGVIGESYRMKTTGRALPPWRCRACGQQFTVKVGTIMEDSKIPLTAWCFAFWKACSGKKGVSAAQIQRQTGVTYKTALFMMHRVRWAMAPANEALPKLGTGGGTVEFDETYVGGKPRRIHLPPKGIRQRKGKRFDFSRRKTPVVAGVERGGRVKARVVSYAKGTVLQDHVRAMVDKSAHLMTDEYVGYKKVGKEYASHERVHHSVGEYVRGDVTTNRIEGFFAGLKRQIGGTHHAVSKKHLHRYVSEVEFKFKYNTRDLDDGERTRLAIQAGVQKRLTYKGQVGQ